MAFPVMSISAAAAINCESDSRPLARLTRDMKIMRDDAWTEFHHRYFSRLYAYALTLHGGDRAAAEDSVQAAYLRAVRHIRRFDEEEIFWSWLTLLLRCSAADQGRKTTARQRLHEKLLNEIQARPGQAADHSNYRIVLLEEALNELNDDDRKLLQAKYHHGDSTEAIANDLQLSAKAVECRLRRLRRKLKTRIHALNRQTNS